MEARHARRRRDHENEVEFKKGWILEVDQEYPEELHDTHNDYPLAPEKKAIPSDQISEYQKRMMNGLQIDMPNTETWL